MTIMDIAGKNYNLKTTTKKINGATIEIKNYINVDMFANMVNTIARTLFDEDEEFCAWNREIAKRFVILKYMTNIEVSELEINEIFKLTQSGDWYNDIERIVTGLPLWGEIEDAVDKQIDYIIATRPTSFDKLCSDISENLAVDNTQNLADIKEILDGLNNVNKKDFVKAVTENVIEKTGGESNGEKSEGATK